MCVCVKVLAYCIVVYSDNERLECSTTARSESEGIRPARCREIEQRHHCSEFNHLWLCCHVFVSHYFFYLL